MLEFIPYSVHVAVEQNDFIDIIGFFGRCRANGDDRGVNSGVGFLFKRKKRWYAWQDSNLRPTD